jgi:hypothetical protein
MKNLSLTALALAALISAPAAQTSTSPVKKVTLVVNFGEPFIIHDQAVQPFIDMMNALKTEKGFTLSILQKTSTAAQKQTILNDLKNQNVVIWANIGQNSFRDAADQALIESWFKTGRNIGYHATIDHHSYWKFWEDLHNGSGFQGHGNGTFSLDNDPEMDGIPALGKMWTEHALGRGSIIQATEIYTLNVYPRGKEGVKVMQTLAAPQQKREFTWHRTIGTGRYIFTCLGHSAADFAGDWLKKATWGWMEYMAGKYDETTSATLPGQPKAFGIEHANGAVTVNSERDFTAEIRDVKGAVVLSRRGFDTGRYSLEGFKPGIYFVKVKGTQGFKSQRVFVR